MMVKYSTKPSCDDALVIRIGKDGVDAAKTVEEGKKAKHELTGANRNPL
jgi:hypothetical protein